MSHVAADVAGSLVTFGQDVKKENASVAGFDTQFKITSANSMTWLNGV